MVYKCTNFLACSLHNNTSVNNNTIPLKFSNHYTGIPRLTRLMRSKICRVKEIVCSKEVRKAW